MFIPSLPISLVTDAAFNAGLFKIVLFSASSNVFGNKLNIDLVRDNELISLGKKPKTYSNSCLAADKTPSNCINLA